VSQGLELPRRISEAFAALAYIVISVLLGALAAVAVVLLALGVLLSVVVIGLPLLLGAVAACHRIAELDRRLANRLLEAHIAALPRPARHGGGPWRRARSTLTDRQLWRVVALAAVKLPLSYAMLLLGVGLVAMTAGLLVLGIEGVGGLSGLAETIYVGPWKLGPAIGLVLCVLAVPAAVVTVAVLGMLGRALRAVTRALLTPPSTEPGAPVREMLAESLGDRTLSIAYWLPDRRIFVDDAGHTVQLPDPGSGRAWTAVEREGRRVAAIVHDAELEAGPDLVHAAAAAASLAIDNEHLKADLRARVEELRVSRMRIVEAADVARRRLERDLHDGAQQQLVSLALDLSLLKAKLRDPELSGTVEELSQKLAIALAELRELARGIHPVILTDRGLLPAVAALGTRVPIPVDVDVEVQERLSPAIEAAAYFVVAEALTNVIKYADASEVGVAIRRAGGDVLVEISDDGVGGAELGAGTGLRGLVDRLAALDGTLEVQSPPGNGTHLVATIPCAAAELAADAAAPGPTAEARR
jgi:signal transduction histidine kinase